MKDILYGEGDLADFYRNYIFIINNYENLNLKIYYHYIPDNEIRSKCFELIQNLSKELSVQLIDNKEILDYFPNHQKISFNFNDDFIVEKQFELEKPSEYIKKFLENNKNFTLIQLDNIFSFNKENFEKSEFIGLLYNINFLSDINPENFRLLTFSDKFHLVTNCTNFIGFRSIYSYFRCFLQKPQIILGKPEDYPKNLINSITFFENKNNLENYLRSNKK
jgi:hypothetical protein